MSNERTCRVCGEIETHFLHGDTPWDLTRANVTDRKLHAFAAVAHRYPVAGPVDPPIPHCHKCGRMSTAVAGMHGVPKCDGRCAPPETTAPTATTWAGVWSNWIAPFHFCPRCKESLNWKQGEDALERPLISAACCGVHFAAELEWR